MIVLSGVKKYKQSKSLIMLKEERYKKILDLIEQKPFYTVDKLAKILYVSKPTIRRDLAELDKRGLIIRYFGGVGRLSENLKQYPYAIRLSIKKKEKKELCRKIAESIKDGDVIFIDSGTTFSFLPDFLLNKKKITVVSNNIPLCCVLMSMGIKTYIIGGELLESSNGAVGFFAQEFVSKFKYDVAIFTSIGITENGDIVDLSEKIIEVRVKAYENSKKNIYVFEHDKMGIDAPIVFKSLKDMDYIITNKCLPDHLKIDRKKVVLTDK